MGMHYRDEMKMDTLWDRGTVNGEFSIHNLNKDDKAEMVELQNHWNDCNDEDMARREGAAFIGQTETVFDGAW